MVWVSVDGAPFAVSPCCNGPSVFVDRSLVSDGNLSTVLGLTRAGGGVGDSCLWNKFCLEGNPFISMWGERACSGQDFVRRRVPGPLDHISYVLP